MRPLPTLLSHALVAFTIEFDNEFERLVPHRTSRHGGSPKDPWLVSMTMWSNFMRFVPEEGIALGEIQRLTGKQWVERMTKWWGYVIVERGVVRPSNGGRRAQEIWRPLAGVIEKRWEERFGHAKIDRLRKALATLVMRFEVGLPEYLPVLEYGLFTPTGRTAGVAVHLAALLSKVLHAFTLDFERESEVSLAICANVVRLADQDGVRLRDLPRLAGVSKEGIQTAVGWLEKRGLLKIEARVARLTAKGRDAREDYLRRVGEVEKAWRGRYGDAVIRELREALGELPRELLFLGAEPHAEGWRASVPRLEVLPDFPMVLHRGGFPDGS